jgi:hypothetical protein
MKHRLRRTLLALTISGVALSTSACATNPIPPPVVSKATLGSVVIYRNGVAYFERHLPPGEKELTLRVPAERVDDLLKSLTIIDEKTGDTMPVSYPTLANDGSDVEMTIGLPKNHHGLRISYVTESPAWKPSYRLMLEPNGKATLQGWAVVDNVSGEDWKQVRVGVGSTSALSFRYDLHSIRVVERETLSSGSLLAVAPPTGGSPYSMATKSQQLVLDVDHKDISGLDELSVDGHVAADLSSETAANHWREPADTPVAGGMKKPPRPTRRSAGSGRAQRAQELVTTLTNRVRGGEQLRIEGYAKHGDANPKLAALERANKLRDKLIENGVDPNQIEAIGNAEFNESEALRVHTALPSGEDEGQAKGAPPPPPIDDGEPLGQAHFLSANALTIKRDHSAMVSIVNAPTKAERVYFYDPISERGSDAFAFNAVRIENPSEYTLDSGPFTVYAEGRFLGEGLADPILPQQSAFIPYALDRNVIVEPEVSGREEIDRLVTIQRGIVSTETRQIRKTKLVITNRGADVASVYVRHQVKPEHTLATLGPEVSKPEKLGGAHLFRLSAPANGSVELVIEEWTPVKRTVDIRTDAGIKAIALYLKAAKLTPELAKDLDEVVKRHTERANLEEHILTLEEQMRVYRTRVDEINIQLVTLRKLPQGQKLRAHLAERMEEISVKLQEGTISLADMKATLMSQRIELQDKLAEITLRSKDDKLAAADQKEQP